MSENTPRKRQKLDTNLTGAEGSSHTDATSAGLTPHVYSAPPKISDKAPIDFGNYDRVARLEKRLSHRYDELLTDVNAINNAPTIRLRRQAQAHRLVGMYCFDFDTIFDEYFPSNCSISIHPIFSNWIRIDAFQNGVFDENTEIGRKLKPILVIASLLLQSPEAREWACKVLNNDRAYDTTRGCIYLKNMNMTLSEQNELYTATLKELASRLVWYFDNLESKERGKLYGFSHQNLEHADRSVHSRYTPGSGDLPRKSPQYGALHRTFYEFLMQDWTELSHEQIMNTVLFASSVFVHETGHLLGRMTRSDAYKLPPLVEPLHFKEEIRGQYVGELGDSLTRAIFGSGQLGGYLHDEAGMMGLFWRPISYSEESRYVVMRSNLWYLLTEQSIRHFFDPIGIENYNAISDNQKRGHWQLRRLDMAVISAGSSLLPNTRIHLALRKDTFKHDIHSTAYWEERDAEAIRNHARIWLAGLKQRGRKGNTNNSEKNRTEPI
ncbi:hypothetical protein BDV96DRAFT_603020 [Lophiotrema nucula]|uniref:Uncharacterized protein n=1 Tax=Lophiotrema nucula TaxID=690887 RepID=A0A6A5YZ86_9PLEO|nr:hypothetical protein BDV96DRAFT_603020 [Lophiotrema nucula]